jgi:hypothetical protein
VCCYGGRFACGTYDPTFEHPRGDNVYGDALFVAIAALLILSVPVTSRSQGVSKRGLDSQQLARLTTRMKSLVDEGGWNVLDGWRSRFVGPDDAQRWNG